MRWLPGGHVSLTGGLDLRTCLHYLQVSRDDVLENSMWSTVGSAAVRRG